MLSAADHCSGCGQWISSGGVLCDDCIDGGRFRRSSFCGAGNCVEVGYGHGGTVLVRDSKDRTGPFLVFTHAEWDAHKAGITEPYPLMLRAMARRASELRRDAAEEIEALRDLLNTQDLKYERRERFKAQAEVERLRAALDDMVTHYSHVPANLSQRQWSALSNARAVLAGQGDTAPAEPDPDRHCQHARDPATCKLCAGIARRQRFDPAKYAPPPAGCGPECSEQHTYVPGCMQFGSEASRQLAEPIPSEIYEHVSVPGWMLRQSEPPAEPVISLAALRALAQGEPLDEVAGDYGVDPAVVAEVAPLAGRIVGSALDHPQTASGDHQIEHSPVCARCGVDVEPVQPDAETIERAAKALRRQSGYESAWEDLPDETKSMWRDMVRVVAAELGSPTGETQGGERP